MNKRNLLYIAAFSVVMIGVVFSLIRSKSGNNNLISPEKNDTPVVEEIVYKFGIPVDSFKVEEIKIKKNEILSNILLKRGIDYNQIDGLVKKSKSVFDVRKIIAGNMFTFFWTKDSLPAVKHIVYEKNAVEFITYTIDDSISVDLGKKEIVYEQREVAGIIESSLWNSLVDTEVSPVLSLEMMDVYQWTIDFGGIHRGDAYRIIYEVKTIEGEAIGISKVLASIFIHGGKENFAYAFEQKGRIEYFDEKGQSLRREFLKAPLDYRRISSKYSNSRFHPILKKYRPHRGIDYAAGAGTKVVSIGDGTVVKISYDKASGNYIKIKHNSVYTSGYMHLQRRPKLSVGDRVSQKQVIGAVGATGYATGPHLDFRIWKNGSLVNPENVKSPPVEPVAEENRTRFDSISSELYNRLNALGGSPRALPSIPE